jgi:hypothetical protein
VQPETKGFENPFQISPTHCKNHTKPTKQSRGTIREWNCALKIKNKKWKKNLGFWGRLGFGILGKKWGKREK